MTPEQLVEDFTAGLPYVLDEFQLVAAPTGTGKTIIGQFGIFMARKYNTRAIYTTPIKALSNQKYRDFSATWGHEHIISSLKDPKQNIFLAAKHLSDLRNIDFPGVSGESMSLEQIETTASRFNLGGAVSRTKARDWSYGKDIAKRLERILDNTLAPNTQSPALGPGDFPVPSGSTKDT